MANYDECCPSRMKVISNLTKITAQKLLKKGLNKAKLKTIEKQKCHYEKITIFLRLQRLFIKITQHRLHSLTEDNKTFFWNFLFSFSQWKSYTRAKLCLHMIHIQFDKRNIYPFRKSCFIKLKLYICYPWMLFKVTPDTRHYIKARKKLKKDG